VRRTYGKNDYSYDNQAPLAAVDHYLPAKFADFLAVKHDILDEVVHPKLQNDQLGV
jgi:hypothetical protein